jgi:L-threonylcarbamoyladenylate synthase
MHTEILTWDDRERASEIIRGGGLVAFPTETVYGLGANALDENAVRRIFEAKWRPTDNPLIVHIADVLDLEKYAINIPAIAYTLADIFWPGALTLVLEKSPIIPSITTAGLETICLRIPDHPIALDLIRSSGCPIAWPSANTSTRPSPTSSQHVLEDLDGRIDAVIEWDITDIGIESTVLDLTVSPPRILRHGWVSREDLLRYTPLDESNTIPEWAKSPGTRYRHYAPDLEIIVIDPSEISEKMRELEIDEWMMILGSTTRIDWTISTYDSLNAFSHDLFARFREAEKSWLQRLYIENLGDIWLARGIMNRVEKAASGK